MKSRRLLLLGLAAIAAVPAMVLAQSQYPITLIPTGKGPYTFPEDYQTP